MTDEATPLRLEQESSVDVSWRAPSVAFRESMLGPNVTCVALRRERQGWSGIRDSRVRLGSVVLANTTVWSRISVLFFSCCIFFGTNCRFLCRFLLTGLLT